MTSTTLSSAHCERRCARTEQGSANAQSTMPIALLAPMLEPFIKKMKTMRACADHRAIGLRAGVIQGPGASHRVLLPKTVCRPTERAVGRVQRMVSMV